eukprot:GGOE01001146.1.p1 GENE.GGOE01001146.1~~GGOE01001146.1.p1  ORF type:complete len:763 (+),score=144.16 GGOE01001146.1:330-2291(+)
MYPLFDLSSATDEQLESCFGSMKGSSWMPSAAALCFGAFIYMDKGSQVARINALVEDDGISQSFFLFNGPFDLPPELTARLVEHNMLQPLTFRTLRASSAVKFSWISSHQFPELDIPHGAFAYKFENPIHDRYFALVDCPVLCSHHRPITSENRELGKLPHELETILHQVAGFALGYPATNKSGASYSLQNQVPFQLRMTTAFLAALGRNPNDKFTIVKTGEGHYEFKPDETEPQGLRWVSLRTPLKDLKHPIRWSSRNAEAWLRKWYTSPVITECMSNLQVDSLEDIFGAGEYDIHPSKLVEFEQSTRIVVGKHLPPFFYRALLSLTGDVHYIHYFWQTKSFALNNFLDPELLQNKTLASNPFARDLMNDLLRKVVDCPPDYGFRDAAHVGYTLERSLTELSTSVVISQEGYFLLGNYNQIVEPTPRTVPILFLATAAIDFDEPDRHPAAQREESRYFRVTDRLPDGTVKGTWRSDITKQEFKARLKDMYDMLFLRCKEAGVTHPSFLPIGLGAFLPRIESSEVKRIYHEAQFELLSEKDYKFQFYFLNPGPGRKEAEEILGKYDFQTEVVLHTKNGKFLASELARAGYRTCCLNPSDCIAMMSGCMGYWWEVGKASRYVGEEDIVATSTFVLASKGISTAYNSARIAPYVP